jgi:hypothetical protein
MIRFFMETVLSSGEPNAKAGRHRLAFIHN